MLRSPLIARLSFCLLFLPARLLAAEPPSFSPDQLDFFEKLVRPILVTRCYECHSGKIAEPKSGLRVDSREALILGGDTGPSIVPGKAKESLLIDAINYGDTFQMPKKSKMPAEEIAVLTKWVDMGAPWTPGDKPVAIEGPKSFDLAGRKAEHWCWRELSNPAVPQVKESAWPLDDLDRFVLVKTEAAGFTPAEPAEKRTLLRRVYFDLVGLPPTPAQVAAFVEDNSAQALTKVVDELLRSPHFGERWGRHWLDLVRYAETRGHEFDFHAPNAYQYRDYVIRALNEDVPYNDLVVEHVAGDLLEKPRLSSSPSPLMGEGRGEGRFNESILGTGFWFLGEWVHSPVDIRKDECDRFDNMVDVFSKTFLGLTVACARCHDHKFDAISQADYYALQGYLQSSSYRLVRFDTMLEEERIAQELEELNKRYEPEVINAIDASQAESKRQIRDYLRVSRTAIQTSASGEALDVLATEAKLDRARLEKWIAAIKSAAVKPDDLLHVWAKICEARGEVDNKLVGSVLSPIYDGWEQRRKGYAKAIADGEVIVDHSRPQEQWLVSGASFELRPVKQGELLWSNDPVQPVAGFAAYSAARRDPTWNVLKPAAGSEQDVGKLGSVDRAGKTIRTPTFSVKAGLVHYLVRGPGHAYASMDSHSVIAGPLHGQIQLDFDKGDGNLRWITHDLRPYQGHRVHVEFSPHADQPFEILRVVQAERAPPLPPPSDIEGFEQAYHFAVSTKEASDSSEAFRMHLILEASPGWLFAHRDLVPADESKTKDVFARYAAERKKITDQIKPESRYAMAMWDGSPEDEVLLLRGNPNTPGKPVPRRMLTALGGTPTRSASEEARSVSEGGSGRLELARELVDPKKNPLVPRVMVNRIWHHLFGRGIVPSVDNFGVLGQEPTHPEMLDHLATRFVKDGWSIKRLIRTIILSRAYQMSSAITDAKAEEADPKNLLWRRTNVRRLEAEAIRDELLAISGRLDRTLYGPSIAVHLTEFLQGRGRPAVNGPLDGAGRRSIYLSVRRNFPSPMMSAFDAPTPFSTIGARNVSNVPAQAMILMNDPFVVQQAELWARRVLAVPNQTREQRIGAMYLAAFARPATTDEVAAASMFLAAQAAESGLPAEAAESDLHVWTDLAHVLVNAKEFIFLN